MSNDHTPKVRPAGARLNAVRIEGSLGPGEALRLAEMQLRVSLMALVGGLVLAGFGGVLVLVGVGGSLDWAFAGLGMTSKLAKASPGVALVVAGVLIILANRFSVKIRSGPKAVKSPTRRAKASTES